MFSPFGVCFSTHENWDVNWLIWGTSFRASSSNKSRLVSRDVKQTLTYKAKYLPTNVSSSKGNHLRFSLHSSAVTMPVKWLWNMKSKWTDTHVNVYNGGHMWSAMVIKCCCCMKQIFEQLFSIYYFGYKVVFMWHYSWVENVFTF